MNYQNKRTLQNFFSKFDIRVLVVFLILILLGITLFFFQIRRHIDCSSVDFSIEAYRKQVGEVIEFKDKTPEAKSWRWNFGDNSETSSDRNPMHKYAKSGAYTVTLQVNGNCTVQKVIEIRDLGEIIDTLKIPKIYAPTVVSVGQPVEFSYSYIGEGFSWEWSFGESGKMDNTSEFPYYSYSIPGVKRVTLVINGDVAHIAKRDIYVKPRRLVSTKKDTIKSYVYEKDPKLFQLPQGNPQKDPLEDFLRSIPAVPVSASPVDEKVKKMRENSVPDISADQFEILLQGVAKQNKTKEDFSQYTCGYYDFPTVKNNSNIITFSELCKNIGGKDIKIESLRLIKNNRNCIEGLEINYKIKKMLIWIKD